MSGIFYHIPDSNSGAAPITTKLAWPEWNDSSMVAVVCAVPERQSVISLIRQPRSPQGGKGDLLHNLNSRKDISPVAAARRAAGEILGLNILAADFYALGYLTFERDGGGWQKEITYVLQTNLSPASLATIRSHFLDRDNYVSADMVDPMRFNNWAVHFRDIMSAVKGRVLL